MKHAFFHSLSLSSGPFSSGGGVDLSDFTWSSDAAGDWNTRVNWDEEGTPGMPAANYFANHTAEFSGAIMANRTAYSDTAVSVRTVTFDNDNRYIIAGAGSVSLVRDTAVGSPVKSNITVAQETHQFQLNVNLQNDIDVNVATNATLEFNNRLFLNGNAMLKTGADNVAFNNNIVTGDGTADCGQGLCTRMGTFGGDLNNSGGTVSPDDSPGVRDASGLLTDVVVPEPATWFMFGIGLVGCLVMLR